MHDTSMPLAMHTRHEGSSPSAGAVEGTLVCGHHRIELCREDGSALRTVMIDECTGAPHEFRGVYRGEVLRVLQSAVPPERIHFGAPVQRLRQDDAGAAC